MHYDEDSMVRRIRPLLDVRLNEIDHQVPFSGTSKVRAQRLAFLWIYGDERFQKEFARPLQEERNWILQDWRAMLIYAGSSPEKHGEDASIGNEILSGVNAAMEQMVDVSTERILLFPVIQAEALAGEEGGADAFLNLCRQADTAVYRSRRHLEWHPYLIYHDASIGAGGEGEKALREAERFLRELVKLGKEHQELNCYPCCLQSDVSGKGQRVSIQKIAKNIITLAAFQNSSFEDVQKIGGPSAPVSGTEESRLFFSASAVSISEPVKSLALSRMRAAFSRLSSGGSEPGQVYEKMEYRFFKEESWQARLRQLPRDSGHVVRTDPVVSVMGGGNSEDCRKEYQKNFVSFARTYYLAPLKEGWRELYPVWWDSFWEEYLARGGALSGIQRLEEEKDVLVRNAPSVPADGPKGGKGSLADMLLNEIRSSQKEFLTKGIEYARDSGWTGRLSEDVSTVLSVIGQASDYAQREAEQEEFFTVTGGPDIGSKQEEASRWLDDEIASDRSKYARTSGNYRTVIRSLMQTANDPLPEEQEGKRILDISWQLVSALLDLVSDSFAGRRAYMHKIDSMDETRLKEIVIALDRSADFPFRRIGAAKADRGMYMLAYRESRLAGLLREMGTHNLAYQESSQNERIELLRVTDLVSVSDVTGAS